MGITYNTSIVRNGMVLHLDAANKKSYPGTGTAWNDMSGNGSNATLVNTVGYSTANKGTMVFDGVDDYATIPSNPAWAVGANATMENWLYFDRTSAGTNHRIWCISNSISSLDIFISTSTNLFSLFGSGGIITSANPIPTKTWFHSCVVFNAGAIEVYFNGVSQNMNGTTTGVNKTNTGTLFLGQFSGGGNYTFQGKIPIYRLYNRGLSLTEVRQNFEALRGRYGI